MERQSNAQKSEILTVNKDKTGLNIQSKQIKKVLVENNTKQKTAGMRRVIFFLKWKSGREQVKTNIILTERMTKAAGVVMKLSSGVKLTSSRAEQNPKSNT